MTGGSVMKGKFPLDTLKRETMEELGIELNVVEELFKNNLFIADRWEYVRDEIRDYLTKNK